MEGLKKLSGYNILETIVLNEEMKNNVIPEPEKIWESYRPPKTLGADENTQLAMDAALKSGGFPALLRSFGAGFRDFAPQFMGYPALAGLQQNSLIRMGVTATAGDMVKKWIELKRAGEPDETDERILELNTLLEDFQVRDLFKNAALKCGFDGGCLVFLDTGAEEEELSIELMRDAATLKGRLKRLVLVEAINIYPGEYNSTDPLRHDYFKPSHWRINGRLVHASRFLYFAPNELPTLLRPSYNFFGIPDAQMALEYVTGFTETKDAAQRLLKKFSTTVFKTNMTEVLTGGSSAMIDRRMRYFVAKRSNDGVMMIDREAEDIIKVETPLSGVVDIVRQSLEFVAAAFRIPFVKYLGITPGGMNATGEYDDDNYNDLISSKQENIFRKPLSVLLDILQYHQWGDIDPDIRLEFIPLDEEDETQKATTRKTDAETNAVYLDRGVLQPSEVRQKIKEDEQSGYSFIEVAEEGGELDALLGLTDVDTEEPEELISNHA